MTFGTDQRTEMRFASFLSGGFTTYYGSNKSTGKETGKTHLCAVVEIVDLVKVKVLTFKGYFIKRNGGLSKKMVTYFCCMNFFL